MSHKRVYFGFALPISLALACAACGQGNQGQPLDNQPAPAVTAPAMNPNPTAGTPFNTPATGATAAGTPMSGATAGGNRGFTAFATLAGSKGYITQSDAMQDHWMNLNFQRCDADHDGKVTRSEYDTCTAGAAMGATAAAPPMSGE